MADLRIPWAPRLILAGRVFRLPIQADGPEVELQADGFTEIDRRWSERDGALYCYLRVPEMSGEYVIVATQERRMARAQIEVRSLEELRRCSTFNGAEWPRRWPTGEGWASVKRSQTLQDLPVRTVGEGSVRWWLEQDDVTVWRQLPPAELPRAHFVNVHQGCPQCGTAIFSHGGFYPWERNHLPCDFRSECPACGAVFPSNDLAAGDFTSGEGVDDGYGYFDEEGHIFLFAATYHRDQVRNFGASIGLLTDYLRSSGFEEEGGRRLGLMLLRYAVEEVYLAAVPQFRYGPSEGVEKPWPWGQTDWGSEADPVAALARKGSVRYSIDTPYISETLALAYDTVWPLVREDEELVERARAFGLGIERPEDAAGLIEEMLASLLQVALDGGAASNLPRVSEGALVLLRGLERADGREVMEWLYDRGPDRLRMFGVDNFFPDGTPPEATGGYNSIHTNGLFSLEYHLRRLREVVPGAYPEGDFPSLVEDSRAARVARAPHEIAMVGRSWFQYGDGSAPGSSAQLGRADAVREGTIRLTRDVFHASMDFQTLERGAEFTGDPTVVEIRDAVRNGVHRRLGNTIHDGVGIAILRTGEAPERAAVGIAYGDTTGHRHMDLLDVQLFAFERPFLTDLGYPQSWASIGVWEAQWATHNSVWGIVPGLDSGRTAGRGRLVRLLEVDGVRLLEVEAERWAWDGEGWYRPGVNFRRLLALVETDGEGVALVDLARIRGGSEHWRVCRGLEGGFSGEVGMEEREGTVAGEGVARGQVEKLEEPDYAALAYMDEVAALERAASWRRSWQSEREKGVHLDLHQLRVNETAEVMTARATAMMGRPEESNYCYRTVLWRNRPTEADETTCVDLVFEPRVGAATLEEVRGVAGDSPTASGVELRTRGGKRVRIYWAPEAGAEDLTSFADGARMRGGLGLAVDGEVVGMGATALEVDGREVRFSGGVQVGRIAALERNERTVEVEGMEGIGAGDRIRVNPEGRGHSYLVESVEDLEAGRVRLRLDVTSLLGRVRVERVEGKRIEADFHVMARTGNLERTRVQREGSGEWGEIAGATNPNTGSTAVELTEELELEVGEWVSLVDYVEGDGVLFEPVCRG